MTPPGSLCSCQGDGDPRYLHSFPTRRSSDLLYAMLVRAGAERRNVVNISTIEDPVEYTIPRVTQIPVNAAAGVEFATGLRALLRQDPNIIKVGEIRDRETADIAVRAALVGRLLISTLQPS